MNQQQMDQTVWIVMNGNVLVGIFTEEKLPPVGTTERKSHYLVEEIPLNKIVDRIIAI